MTTALARQQEASESYESIAREVQSALQAGDTTTCRALLTGLVAAGDSLDSAEIWLCRRLWPVRR